MVRKWNKNAGLTKQSLFLTLTNRQAQKGKCSLLINFAVFLQSNVQVPFVIPLVSVKGRELEVLSEPDQSRRTFCGGERLTEGFCSGKGLLPPKEKSPLTIKSLRHLRCTQCVTQLCERQNRHPTKWAILGQFKLIWLSGLVRGLCTGHNGFSEQDTLHLSTKRQGYSERWIGGGAGLPQLCWDLHEN